MYIRGMGLIFSQGRGVGKFEEAIGGPWKEPPCVDGNKPAYTVDPDAIKDKVLLKKLRRSDKFSKMAVLAAADALADGGIDDTASKKIGIILATGYGPHVTTFKFLDDIRNYGEDGVSPIAFSNSVHNAAASYVAETLGIEGPTLTVTQFHHSFYHAMLLARLWLDDKRADYVLVGGVEQYGEVLDYIYDSKLKRAPDGKIKPFNFSPAFQVPGEGAAFFLVGDSRNDDSFCRVEDIILDWDKTQKKSPDICIIDADGMMPDESAYSSCLSADIPVAAYSSVFGSMMIGSAFNCAAGALMLKNKTVYANPVAENPHNLKLLNKSYTGDIELISCVRYNCHRKGAGIYLAKC